MSYSSAQYQAVGAAAPIVISAVKASNANAQGNSATGGINAAYLDARKGHLLENQTATGILGADMPGLVVGGNVWRDSGGKQDDAQSRRGHLAFILPNLVGANITGVKLRFSTLTSGAKRQIFLVKNLTGNYFAGLTNYADSKTGYYGKILDNGTTAVQEMALELTSTIRTDLIAASGSLFKCGLRMDFDYFGAWPLNEYGWAYTDIDPASVQLVIETDGAINQAQPTLEVNVDPMRIGAGVNPVVTGRVSSNGVGLYNRPFRIYVTNAAGETKTYLNWNDARLPFLTDINGEFEFSFSGNINFTNHTGNATVLVQFDGDIQYLPVSKSVAVWAAGSCADDPTHQVNVCEGTSMWTCNPLGGWTETKNDYRCGDASVCNPPLPADCSDGFKHMCIAGKDNQSTPCGTPQVILTLTVPSSLVIQGDRMAVSGNLSYMKGTSKTAMSSAPVYIRGLDAAGEIMLSISAVTNGTGLYSTTFSAMPFGVVKIAAYFNGSYDASNVYKAVQTVVDKIVEERCVEPAPAMQCQDGFMTTCINNIKQTTTLGCTEHCITATPHKPCATCNNTTYQWEEGTACIEPLPISHITLTVWPEIIANNKASTIRVSLTDNGYLNSILDKTVVISLKDRSLNVIQTLHTYTTDTAKDHTFEVKGSDLGVTGNNYYISADFAGDSTYQASTAAIGITINAASPCTAPYTTDNGVTLPATYEGGTCYQGLKYNCIDGTYYHDDKTSCTIQCDGSLQVDTCIDGPNGVGKYRCNAGTGEYERYIACTLPPVATKIIGVVLAPTAIAYFDQGVTISGNIVNSNNLGVLGAGAKIEVYAQGASPYYAYPMGAADDGAFSINIPASVFSASNGAATVKVGFAGGNYNNIIYAAAPTQSFTLNVNKTCNPNGQPVDCADGYHHACNNTTGLWDKTTACSTTCSNGQLSTTEFTDCNGTPLPYKCVNGVYTKQTCPTQNCSPLNDTRPTATLCPDGTYKLEKCNGTTWVLQDCPTCDPATKTKTCLVCNPTTLLWQDGPSCHTEDACTYEGSGYSYHFNSTTGLWETVKDGDCDPATNNPISLPMPLIAAAGLGVVALVLLSR